MFRFLLVLPDGTPRDPAVFATAIPNWAVREEFIVGDGSRFRILDMNTNMTDDQLEELHSHAINGIWMSCLRNMRLHKLRSRARVSASSRGS